MWVVILRIGISFADGALDIVLGEEVAGHQAGDKNPGHRLELRHPVNVFYATSLSIIPFIIIFITL